MCARRLPFWEKHWGQCSHMYGRLPVCLVMWISIAPFWLNAFPHVSHVYGFSPTSHKFTRLSTSPELDICQIHITINAVRCTSSSCILNTLVRCSISCYCSIILSNLFNNKYVCDKWAYQYECEHAALIDWASGRFCYNAYTDGETLCDPAASCSYAEPLVACSFTQPTRILWY